MRYRMDFTVSAVSLLLVLNPAPSSGDVEQGQKIANRAVSLIKRTLAVDLPKELPEALRAVLPVEAAHDYTDGGYKVPGAGFFEPAFLRIAEPQLSKEVEAFWRIAPSRKTLALPFLAESYTTEGHVVQGILAELIVEIASDSFDVRGAAPVIENTVLSLLENSVSSDHDSRFLSVLEGTTVTISDAGFARLIRIAEEWSKEGGRPRCQLVRVLAVPSKSRNPPDAVHEYLMHVAEHDRDDECRVAAISLHELQTYDSGILLPVYLGVLRSELCGDEAVATRVVKAVGVWGRYREAVPELVLALESCHPLVRAMSVIALEKTVGIDRKSVPEDRLVFNTDYDYADKGIEAEAAQRLERAVSWWKSWWDNEGDAFLASERAI